MEVALRKYKSLLYRNGSAPVLVVPDFPHVYALVYECTLHSAGERGTVLYRTFSSVTSDGAPLPDLNATLGACLPLRKGMATEKDLPTEAKWNRLVEEALFQAKNEAQNVLQQVNLNTKILSAQCLALESLASEEKPGRHSKVKFKTQFLKARRDWIQELRMPAMNKETNEPLVRVQPIAVLIPGKRVS